MKKSFFDLVEGDIYGFEHFDVTRLVLFIDDSNRKIRKIYQIDNMGRVVQYDYWRERYDFDKMVKILA